MTRREKKGSRRARLLSLLHPRVMSSEKQAVFTKSRAAMKGKVLESMH